MRVLDVEDVPSLEARPLHSTELPDGFCYWACEMPERPWSSSHTWYDIRCHACRVHMTATIATLGDTPCTLISDKARPVPHPNDERLSLAQLLDLGLRWQAEQ